MTNDQKWKPAYSRWRHGGWYTNVTYPSGASGCVSRNYPDGKWRIVCDPRRTTLGAPDDYTFSDRDAATHAERELVKMLKLLDTLEQVEKWASGYGTKTQSEIREEIRDTLEDFSEYYPA